MALAQPVTADAFSAEAPPVARLVIDRLRTLVEVDDPDDLDDEVVGWLTEAAARA